MTTEDKVTHLEVRVNSVIARLKQLDERDKEQAAFNKELLALYKQQLKVSEANAKDIADLAAATKGMVKVWQALSAVMSVLTALATVAGAVQLFIWAQAYFSQKPTD